MRKFDGKKLLPVAVIALLCFFFVFGVVWGANSLLEMEGTMIPANLTEGVVACPQTKQDALALLNGAIDNALEIKPALSVSDSVRFGTNDDDEDKAENEGDGIRIGDEKTALAATVAKHIKDSASDALEDSFPDLSADYGEGLENKLWLPNITADDITDFKCTYIYYVCPQCEEDFDTPSDRCPACDNPEPLEKRYHDDYVLTLDLTDAAATKTFRMRTQSDIDGFIGNAFENYLTCGDFEAAYSNIKITARINRFSLQIYSLEYYKKSDINTSADFTGMFEQLGKQPVYFTSRESVKFSFSWAGIKLSSDSLSMEFGTTEALKATLTCNEPVKQTVTWASSDESVATVDSEGYVKSGKKSGKTIITASFVFNGKTYSDECEIFVKTAVESLDISKRKLELRQGENFTLSATVSPKKATVKTVTWYSDNEAVATVDNNGTITAVSPGAANIYALSDDGFYKATCKTEVVS
ncbi:MAG: hypothetical protein GX051_05935 [Clostridiales bacterium]|nr:hypothetical protein [Clostridiales bacterium]